jgi:hypothetical protein
MGTETDKFRTSFAGVFRVEGDPYPRLSYRHEARRTDGESKTIWGGIEVRDEATLARVERELRPGDEIEIEVEVDWDAPGIPIVLVGFSKIADSAAAA